MLPDWALPDQLVYSVVSSLLQLANSYPQFGDSIINAVLEFSATVVEKIQSFGCTSRLSLLSRTARIPMQYYPLCLAAEILSQLAPAFHGFYRALLSTTYRWTPQHWSQLSRNLNPLFDQNSIEALNRLVIDIIQLEEIDPEAIQFVTTLLARYVSRGRPLSGYFLICCVIEVQWTVLTQALIPLDLDDEEIRFSEAAAANHAWTSLLRSPVATVAKTDKAFAAALEASKELSMECFTDLLVQIEEMDAAPSQDSYASETMSESLVSSWNAERKLLANSHCCAVETFGGLLRRVECS
jgi:phosphatidylinositol 4-kinase